MEVAFISEFVNGRRHFRYVDELQPGGPVQVGNSDPLEKATARASWTVSLPS